MPRSLNITLPDDVYERLRSAAHSTHQTAEELATSDLTRQYGHTPALAAEPPPAWEDPVLALLRAQGHLVNIHALPPHAVCADLPPVGSPEEARMLEEIGREASEALERMGIRLSDLVER